MRCRARPSPASVASSGHASEALGWQQARMSSPALLVLEVGGGDGAVACESKSIGSVADEAGGAGVAHGYLLGHLHTQL